MSEEFNWLEYAEPEESAPAPSPEGRSRRFWQRRPRLPGMPRLRGRLRLPRLRRPRLPRLPLRPRRRAEAALDQRSAADLLGRHEERPLEELDDRLRLLHERSSASASPEADSRQALFDVDELLVTPEILKKPGGVISAAALSKAQQQQVELLRDIVGGAQADESGERSYRPSPPAFSLNAVPRVIGSLLLLLVVSLPFVSSDFAEGELPPAAFDENRPGATAVFDALDNLTPDDYVLVAFEYGPTAAGELDSIAELFLRHIVAQRALPLIVSSNPIAVVHAQNIIRRINRSVALSGNRLQPGRDYYILRYLPGGSLGLRELSENFADVVRVSAKGALTGLEFDSLDELAAIVTIVERAEDMRNWAEQVATEINGTRILAASSYAAAPLAQVYADNRAEIVGLLVGYRDAYTYDEKLQSAFGAQPSGGPEAAPAVAPVSPNIAVALREEPEPEAAAQAELAGTTAMPPATATPLPVTSPTATATPLPSATPLATSTPPPTMTALPTATVPPAATDPPKATATLETMRIVEVVSPQQVRIRRGPTTVDDILQLARAGDTFALIGTNGDGSWFRLALANGIEGWIAEFLVEEKVVTVAEFQAAQSSASAQPPNERVYLRAGISLSLGKTGPRYYQITTPLTGDIPEYVLLRDRTQEAARLSAMTFGTLAAILAIAAGNVFYALGALRRRRVQRKR